MSVPPRDFLGHLIQKLIYHYSPFFFNLLCLSLFHLLLLYTYYFLVHLLLVSPPIECELHEDRDSVLTALHHHLSRGWYVVNLTMCFLREWRTDGLSKKHSFMSMEKCVELVMEGLCKLPARSVRQKGQLGDPTGSNPVRETTKEISTTWEP